MNARIALSLASTVPLVAALIASQPGEPPTAAEAVTSHVVELRAVIVRPAAADALHYRSRKVVDLATITVHPDPRDMAAFVADSMRRVGCLC